MLFLNVETNERYRLFIVQTFNRVDCVSFAVGAVTASMPGDYRLVKSSKFVIETMTFV